MKQGKGSLFLSHGAPEVSGYLVIDGEGYEIIGWRPSSARVDFSAKQIAEPAERNDGHDGSASGARKCDTA